jgi:hypothetical protein
MNRLPSEAKLELLEGHIEYLRKLKTSPWYKSEPLEILAGELWSAPSVPKATKANLWYPVKRESALLEPVADWYAEDGWKVYEEVPLGRNRADLVAHFKGGFLQKERLSAIELKNNLAELKRGMNQMATYAQYTNRVYLACTPWLAAEFLHDHASARSVKRWDPLIFNNKLERAGFGLLIVQGSEVEIVVAATSRKVSGAKRDDLMAQLTTKRLIREG